MTNRSGLAHRPRRLLSAVALSVMGVIAHCVQAADDEGPRQQANGQYEVSTDTYRVAAGDALSGIAERFKTTVGALTTLNALASDRILVGQPLRVGMTGVADLNRDETAPVIAPTDPLPSWRAGSAKQSVLDFVTAVTDVSSADFVPVADRIATFDNDGTLWVEHPMYTQLAFALDRIKTLAPDHPEWQTQQPFKAVLDNDFEALAAAGEKGIAELVMASHTGMSTADFEAIVTDWLATAQHPRFKRRYTELAYQPMLDLLAYLRANGFKTYIVSGGGVEFMRPMTQTVYGIPPEHVIGSSIQTKYEIKDGKPVLIRQPAIAFIDDKSGKPVGINTFIGRRPIAAFGNSAGDREMLEWTGAGEGARLMMLVFHDDADREYAYGPANGLPDTKFGTFPPSLMDEAAAKGWIVISMKHDWAHVFAHGE